MSNTDFRTDQRSSQGLADKLQQAGEDVKQRASDAFTATSEVAREKLDELGTAARETASQATDKVKEQISAQQDAGADYARRLANNIRGAAKAFEQDTPIAARTIEMAAGYVEDAAEKMRNGSLNDVMDGMTSFARRQPAAFLGLSVLAGFAAVRFLKATAGNGTASQHRGARPSGGTPSQGDIYGSQSSGARRPS
jgi:gas vesicle protein